LSVWLRIRVFGGLYVQCEEGGFYVDGIGNGSFIVVVVLCSLISVAVMTFWNKQK